MNMPSTKLRCWVLTIASVLPGILSAQELRNLAPESEIASTPYIGATTVYLVDGEVPEPENTLAMSAPLAPRVAGGVPLTYEFVFPQAVEIHSVRLYQYEARGGRIPASRYTLEADTDNDGKYETVLSDVANGAGGKWYSHAPDRPVVSRRIRFVTNGWVAVKGPNYGVPALAEVEILGRGPERARQEDLSQQIPALRRSGDGHTFADAVTTSIPWRDQYPRGMFSTIWRFWAAGKPYESRRVGRILDKIRDMNANRLWLYTEMAAERSRSYPGITAPDSEEYRYFTERRIQNDERGTKKGVYKFYPYPSKVVPGYKRNILSRLVDQAHSNQLAVIVNQQFLPYGLRGWDFPRVMDYKKYPCVLSSPFVEDASIQLYREVMESGVDGLALGGDEFFLHSHTVGDETASPFCKKYPDKCRPTCTQLFAAQYGHELSPNVGKSGVEAMEWLQFGYERLARLFSRQADVARAVRSDAIVTSLFRPGEVKRPTYGVAYDIIGYSGAVDEMSSDPLWTNDNHNGHYYIANELLKLTGATPHRRATVSLQTTPFYDRDGYHHPVMVYGAALSAVMHGASGVNFYKEEYLAEGGKRDSGPWAKKVFGLIAALDAVGLREHSTPKRLALLYSRASEDWWATKYKSNGVRLGYPVYYQNAVMEVLFRAGIPFDLYYLDQPESLGRLHEYKAVIVPFGHAVSDLALTRLSDLARSGVPVLWLEGRAEVTELGANRGADRWQVLLADVVERTEIPLNSYNPFSRAVISHLKSLAPGAIANECDADALADVECGLLESEDGYLLFATNWSRSAQHVNVKPRLGAGYYKVKWFTLDRVHDADLEGGVPLSSQSLAEFSLRLEAGEALVLQLTRVSDSGRAAP